MANRKKIESGLNIESNIPIVLKKMDVSVYRTISKDYQLWVDVLFEKFKLPFPIPAILLGLIAFLIGLLISLTISFQRDYLNTLAIYLGTFGIIWVLAILNYSSRTFHEAYEELRPCFLITDDEYSQIIKRWFKLFSDNRGNYWGVFVLFLIAMGTVYIVFFQPEIMVLIKSDSLKEAFPPAWSFPQNKEVKAVIVGIWGLLVAFPLGTAARLLIYNFLFLLKLRNLPVIPVPSMIKTRLQKISNLYIFIASTWFVGVGLFGVLLFEKLNLLSFLILAILSLFGTITFLTPQFIYRQFLVQSHKVASQWILHSFYTNLNINLEEKPRTKIPTELGSKLTKMENLNDFIEVSKQTDVWVYDPTDFLLLMLGQVISFGSVYIENIIKTLTP